MQEASVGGQGARNEIRSSEIVVHNKIDILEATHQFVFVKNMPWPKQLNTHINCSAAIFQAGMTSATFAESLKQR